MKLKKLSKNPLLLVSLTFLLVLLNSSVVTSKTFLSNENPHQTLPDRQKVYQISQNFLDIDFGESYYSKTLEADRFYKQGNLQKAKEIQREVKPDFKPVSKPPTPLGEAKNLPPDSQQYWLTASQEFAKKPNDKDVIKDQILKPLKNLVAESPEFVPGHIMLAQTHFNLLSKEKDGLEVIEKASELYPGRDDVLDTRIELLLKEKKYLKASIAAREFAATYPDYYKSSQYQKEAKEYYQQYRNSLKDTLKTKGILGAGGEVLVNKNTEGALDLTKALIDGESSTGTLIAEGYKSESSMISNANQLKYLNDIGQKLAQLTGRDDFTYEFNIIDDPSPNAFALPGGKIFFHTGMLELMGSEAELAGVLSHEIAHVVLSHGYEKLVDSTLLNVGGSIFSQITGISGNLVNAGLSLVSSKFSRDKEKEADILGLRVLNAADYAADGLYNVMAKLSQLEGESSWSKSLLSSHPASKKRMRYLEELIQTRGYNRYGYEGVAAYRKVFP